MHSSKINEGNSSIMKFAQTTVIECHWKSIWLFGIDWNKPMCCVHVFLHLTMRKQFNLAISSIKCLGLVHYWFTDILWGHRKFQTFLLPKICQFVNNFSFIYAWINQTKIEKTSEFGFVYRKNYTYCFRKFRKKFDRI